MLGNTDSIHEILVIVQNSDDPLPLLWTQKLISHILIHGHISAKIIWIFPFETQIGLVECATNKTFIKTSLANRLDELPKQTNSKSQPSFVGMAIICLTIWADMEIILALLGTQNTGAIPTAKYGTQFSSWTII